MSPGLINIKVVGSGDQEVHFRVKRTTPLRKVMNAYCERQGEDIASFQFLFDGDGPNIHPMIWATRMVEE